MEAQIQEMRNIMPITDEQRAEVAAAVDIPGDLAAIEDADILRRTAAVEHLISSLDDIEDSVIEEPPASGEASPAPADPMIEYHREMAGMTAATAGPDLRPAVMSANCVILPGASYRQISLQQYAREFGWDHNCRKLNLDNYVPDQIEVRQPIGHEIADLEGRTLRVYGDPIHFVDGMYVSQEVYQLLAARVRDRMQRTQQPAGEAAESLERQAIRHALDATVPFSALTPLQRELRTENDRLDSLQRTVVAQDMHWTRNAYEDQVLTMRDRQAVAVEKLKRQVAEEARNYGVFPAAHQPPVRDPRIHQRYTIEELQEGDLDPVEPCL